MAGLTGYEGGEAKTYYENQDAHVRQSGGASVVPIFMTESLFLLPDSFDDEMLALALEHLDDPEILFVAGDLRSL